MPPAYVKPYVKRNKNDGRDAEAICEAVNRPTIAVRAGEERGAAGRRWRFIRHARYWSGSALCWPTRCERR